MTENEKKMIALLEWSVSEYIKLYPENDYQGKVYAYLDVQSDKLKSNPSFPKKLMLTQTDYNKLVDSCVKFVKIDYNLDKGGVF